MLTLIGFCCIFTLALANGKQGKLTRRGKAFIEKMAPAIYHANMKVLHDRQMISGIKEYFYYTGNLSNENRSFLITTAARYDYTDYVIHTDNYRNDLINALDELLSRVDIVPIRMVLAQAIIETAWGKSDAAQVTNNYFGITYRGSGGRLVTSSATCNYYLKEYDSLEDGIADYIHLLNTKRSYKKFRDLRRYCRINELPLQDEVLTAGLVKYSELGEVYVAKVNHVIQKYLYNDLKS